MRIVLLIGWALFGMMCVVVGLMAGACAVRVIVDVPDAEVQTPAPVDAGDVGSEGGATDSGCLIPCASLADCPVIEAPCLASACVDGCCGAVYKTGCP